MKLLLIGTRQMLQNMPADLDLHVTLLGKELCLVVSVKDLGVHMDATISFDEHITSITSSCLSSLSQINRVKHLLDRNTLLNIINALVFSKLVRPTGLVRQRRISTNYRMSKTSTRIITRLQKFDHITPVLTELNWLSNFNFNFI